MKLLMVIGLAFALSGCETFADLYETFVGEDEETCLQLESGAWIIYSPDGKIIDCTPE